MLSSGRGERVVSNQQVRCSGNQVLVSRASSLMMNNPDGRSYSCAHTGGDGQ